MRWALRLTMALASVVDPGTRAFGAPPAEIPIAGAKPGKVGVTGEDVDLAIRRALDFIWSKQSRDGRWISPKLEKTFPDGLTAVTAYTLRAAGVPLSDRRLQRAVRKLLDRTDTTTVYARAFTLLLWCSLGRQQFERQIDEDVHFLKLQQSKDGGWGYGTLTDAGPGEAWTDNSSSQLALFALSEAALSGAKVSANIWRRADQSWLRSANADGGWGYALSDDPEFAQYPRHSTKRMTAAGLASLYILYDQLYLNAELAFNGRFKAKCGQDIEKTRPIRQAIDRGWQWIALNYRDEVTAGPESDQTGKFDETFLTYYPLCLTRAAATSGRKRIAAHVWYADVASSLVQSQKDDGSWGDVRQTCFAVLALARGRSPVLINKLKYGEHDGWNKDRRDAGNLTRWFSAQLGTPLTWQVVELTADNGDIYDAPVLLITGHEAPKLPEMQRQGLRDFVHAGGTVLAVACCSRPEFTEGCRTLFSDLFPTFDMATLPDDHQVWTMHEAVEPGDDCIAFSDGCRTSIFLLPGGACCAWQQNLIKREKRHFSLAGNILRYATYNHSFRGRLAPYFEMTTADPLRRLSVARLIHGGDWWVDRDALKHLSSVLSARAGLGLGERSPVRPEDLGETDVSVLWLTGHEFEAITPEGQAQLRAFLNSGGTLISSACCGRGAFDEAFHGFAVSLFGSESWKRIKADDSLMTGSFLPGLASSLHAMSYKQRYGANPPPRLDWPILYGLRDKGRWAVIYSPYDVSCGLSPHTCLDCVGYVPRDAQAIVANVMLYVAEQRKVTNQRSAPKHDVNP